jgi:hypothetical protein
MNPPMLIPLIAIIVIAFVYRSELGTRALLVYGGAWATGFAIVISLDLSPGIFVAFQCALAIAMLIHVRANPDIPLR